MARLYDAQDKLEQRARNRMPTRRGDLPFVPPRSFQEFQASLGALRVWYQNWQQRLESHARIHLDYDPGMQEAIVLRSTYISQILAHMEKVVDSTMYHLFIDAIRVVWLMLHRRSLIWTPSERCMPLWRDLLAVHYTIRDALSEGFPSTRLALAYQEITRHRHDSFDTLLTITSSPRLDGDDSF